MMYSETKPEDQVDVGQSRQVTALAKKAISFQKRQMFTNVCCIALCPFLMVLLAALLGNLILGLIRSASPISGYMYCSKEPAMNEINLPIWKLDDARLPKSGPEGIVGADILKPGENLYHVNWALIRGQLGLSGPPGAQAQNYQRVCVNWFGEEYPQSPLYERPANTNGTAAFIRDSTYYAQPLGGWIAALAKDNVTFDRFSQSKFINAQQKSWSLVGAAQGVDATLIGQKEIAPTIGILDFRKLLAPSPPFDPKAKGLLSSIPTRYFVDLDLKLPNPVKGVIPTPWYNQTLQTPDQLDEQISSLINEVILQIAAIDKIGLTDNKDPTVANNIFIEIGKLLSGLPHGSLYFTEIDHEKMSYSWDAQYGDDIRLAGSSNFPAPGARLLYQQTQLDNGILRNSNSTFGGKQITQGLRLFPQFATNEIQLPFGGIIGNILYPFGVSFLLPIFVILLVQEKENRILVMMKMNGMKSWAYYFSHYVTMLTLFIVSASVFFATGYFANLTLFTQTEFSVIAILFFLWGNVQIALAFLFSTLFDKSRAALVTTFLMVLCSVIVSLSIQNLFVEKAAPILLFLWPPFAFYRALGLCNVASYDGSKLAARFSDLFNGSELSDATLFLFISVFILMILTFYFDAVLPSEFGVTKPWFFPFTDIAKLFKAKKKKENMIGTTITNNAETNMEDDDVRAERARVCDPQFPDSDYPLVMKNMRKVYGGRGGAGPKLAVKDVSFAVEKGITFGLLGPNGAGKSTLISILTGLYGATSGTASLAGFDIKTETAGVYKSIGICPQFDILWDELTIGEHLYFYARLKGVSFKDEKRAVRQALAKVSLTAFENRLTKGLSGGEKRRLSIAIALLGAPRVIFLDEPTTGLDPEVRRLIWNIVNEARQDKTVILTTHSMEEAEALCQRIGIMAKGTLRCLGDQLRLKDLYGTGFKLYANALAVDMPNVTKYIESILPTGWEKIDSYDTNISYEFPAVKGAISKLFIEIEATKSSVGILDWGLGQTTLEEVFVRLITEADAEAEY